MLYQSEIWSSFILTTISHRVSLNIEVSFGSIRQFSDMIFDFRRKVKAEKRLAQSTGRRKSVSTGEAGVLFNFGKAEDS